MTNIQAPLTDIAAATDSIPTVKQELAALKTMPFDEFINTLVSNIVHFAISLAVAIAVFYIGKFIIRKLYGMVAGIMIRRDVDRSLSTFVLSLVRMVLYFILIVTVIGILGINTSSFIAIFASAGVAIGMALSGTLQNFAGGVLILLLKPYRIGDYIEAQGFAGRVTEIQIFHTIILTPDNKSIIIPNGGLSTGSINNWSREDYRRVEWSIGISYGDSVGAARAAILAMLGEEPRIVSKKGEDVESEKTIEDGKADAESSDAKAVTHQPKRGFFSRVFGRRGATFEQMASKTESEHLKAFVATTDYSSSVNVSELADSSVNLVVRAWVRSADYWPVYYALLERFYNELPAAGINFPFPQLDVHLERN